MKQDQAQGWKISDEMLLESAEKRFGNGDYLGALTMLNKRARMYAPSADALALYADVYEALELYPLAADAWFRFLDVCNEADFGEGYEGLAVAFMNMGNELQSAFYYHRAYSEGELPAEEIAAFAEALDEPRKPKLRFADDEGFPEPEKLREGLALLKAGELEEARNKLLEIPQESSDYSTAAGLSAMCTLMLGDEEGAERECEELLKTHPENVQALTTYCAVLGARGNKEGAREVAQKLSVLPVEGTDDLYRIATALCETGLHEEAFRVLTALKSRLPYDDNVLYFHAVAGYHTERLEEAIDSLERLTTVYPRKAVASYYLERMRELRDGEGERFPMTYYYRVPEEEYRTVANFLLTASQMGDRELQQVAQLPQLEEFFRIAFDEMEGRDEKLLMLAAKVAARTRSDDFLREVLLDCEADEFVKLSILHELTLRNEDESYGTVFLNLYREFFIHHIDIGPKRAQKFMLAFADVYSKYALLSEENEAKLCAAAEDIYHSLEEADAWDYMDERSELAAAIYREARIKGGERSVAQIAELFGANRYVIQEILDFLM